MDGSVVLVVLRLLVSLGVVLTLLVLLARWARKRGLGGAVGTRAGVQVEVLSRRALGRGSAVHVVRVGEQVLVLGVTDQQVSLLRELSADVLAEPEPVAAPEPSPAAVPAVAAVPDFASALRMQAAQSGLDLGPLAAAVPAPATSPALPATRAGRRELERSRHHLRPRPAAAAPRPASNPVPTGWPWNAATLVVGAIKGSRA
ncbi:flagellar biosynthetic protein FliO [Arthrobacter sp. NEB 688]|uniref:flagellar biosynthetic protein FliO n=1 Tax=Arthrobacter sp. NEB 688 TaxID=904039 RepID=UPI00156626C6|nr:flagellar biosynthetic protein FliO [Arthrobacter sp. NEB 688]QKE82661.1 flagellar biosynthetic protein FliO [Arthrobacter sp. NEB 688]